MKRPNKHVETFKKMKQARLQYFLLYHICHQITQVAHSFCKATPYAIFGTGPNILKGTKVGNIMLESLL